MKKNRWMSDVKAKRVSVVFLCMLLGMVAGWTQQRQEVVEEAPYPKVGDLCPDLHFSKVQYDSDTELSVRDFSGKWLVLFFWSHGCSASVEQMKVMHEVAEVVKDSVTTLFIAKDQPYNRIIDSVYRKTYGYSSPAVFESKAIERFGIAIYSYTVVIDPSGRIQAIATWLTLEDLKAMMAGKNPKLHRTYNLNQRQEMYQLHGPEHIDLTGVPERVADGHSGQGIRYQAILRAYDRRERPEGRLRFERYKQGNEVFVAGADMARLYLLAYGSQEFVFPPYNDAYEKWWYRPVLEGIQDTTAFGWDYTPQADLYTYYMKVRGDSVSLDKIQQLMQQELKRRFGYQVRVETREMPYWKLEASKESAALLATRGDSPLLAGNGYTEFTMINQPMSKLVQFIWAKFQDGAPFIDETGILGNIDIKLEGVFMDWERLQQALKPYGLSLVKGTKKMNVVVINEEKEN